MSVKAVFVLVILGLVAWAQPGHAEKVKANQPTKVFSRAGEQSPVVIKVKAGQVMTVINTDGRWLKVRVSGRTGWVPRSKVDAQESDEFARVTRRRPFVDGRSTSRGFGGETGPDDRIGADATGATSSGDDKDDDDSGGKSSKSAKPDRSAKPDKPDKSDKADRDEPKRTSKPAPASAKDSAKDAGKGGAKAAPKDDADDDVISVDDDDDKPAGGGDGESGGGDGDGEKQPARPMAHVAKKTSAHEKPDPDSDEAFTIGQDVALYIGKSQGDWTRVSTDEGDAGWVLTSKLDIEQPEGGGNHAMQINARGRLGLNFVKQSLSTPGGMQVPPDNYSASSPTLAISLGGTVLYPYSKRYVLGGDLGYDYNKAISGIAFMGQTTGFTYHNFNLRALGGYDLQKPNGMVVFARLGFHFDSFQVDDVGDFTKNTAKLPNQIIEAPTLGVGLMIPRLTPKIGVNISLDTILVGASVDQTKNLEDGTGPSAKAAYLTAGLTYRWKPNMDLQASYDLAYTSISFTGPAPMTSMRGHTGTGTSSGTDFNNALSFGIVYGF